MEKNLIPLSIESPEQKSLTFDLADPQMTLMHRVGLAGLYMTLQQLDRDKDRDKKNSDPNSQIPLQWEFNKRSITLRWQGKDIDAMTWLLQESFQLENGMICLRGLDAKKMPVQYLAIVHQGILGTLLQHNSTHKKISIKTSIYYEDEESYPLIIQYKELQSYVYQNFAQDLCDKKTGNLSQKPISIAGWLNPGAVVRHTSFPGDTSFEEPAHLALILLFASVACCYFVLRSNLREQKAQYALVIPEIRDLEQYAQYRRKLRNQSFKEFWASSLADAGFQFLTMADKMIKKSKSSKQFKEQEYPVPSCQVITMGTVAWSTQQKTRTDIYLVSTDGNKGKKAARTYQVSREYLEGKIVRMDRRGESFISPSLARELIADNLARGKPWYTDFSCKIASNDLFEKLTYEREGLNQMIQSNKVEWNEKLKIEGKESDRLFVEACHEALSYTYGQLSSRTKDDEQIRFDKVNERFRTRLVRCKNGNNLREFIMDFWARAGRLPTVQANWEILIQLITNDWKAARDLALLALVSYKGKENSAMISSNHGVSEEQLISAQVADAPDTSSSFSSIPQSEFDEED